MAKRKRRKDTTRGYAVDATGRAFIPGSAYDPSYVRRLASARRSALATARFGHQEPSASELAKRFNITLADAKKILLEVFGDVILERAPRAARRPVLSLFGRGLGLGNIMSIP